MVKDGNNNTLATINLDKSVYDSSNQNIWVLSRSQNNWNVTETIGSQNPSVVNFTTSNSDHTYTLTRSNGQNVWLSFKSDLSSYDAGNNGNDLASVSLTNNLHSVTLWSGNQTVADQVIPSNLKLSVGNDFAVSVDKFRGFAQGDSLTIKRAQVKVQRGNVVKSLDALYANESRAAVDFMDAIANILSMSSLKMVLKANPSANGEVSTATINVSKPEVTVCVNNGENGNNLVKATANLHSKLQFKNMNWVTSANGLYSAEPFTSMFSLKNMILPNENAVKLSFRSAKMLVTKQNSVSDATDSKDEQELLVSMNSSQSALFVGKTDSNSKRHGLALWKSDADNNVILDPMSGYALALPVMYKLSHNDAGVNKVFVDRLAVLLNDVNEKSGAMFAGKNVMLSGVNAELNAVYNKSALNYSLSVPNNKFSIRSRPNGSSAGYVVLVDASLLSNSQNFLNNTYTYTESETGLQCQMLFSNPLQRPIAWGPSLALVAKSSKVLRFNSWHIDQTNDANGATKVQLVRLSSQGFNVENNGSISSSNFKDVDGMKLLKLMSVKRQVMNVDGDASHLKKLSRYISVFDHTGTALSQWGSDIDHQLLSLTGDSDEKYIDDADVDPDMSNRVEPMVSLLLKDQNIFDSKFNKQKTPSGSKTCRIILQDLMQQHNHNGHLVLRVDPAGGIHTHNLYSANQNVYLGNLVDSAQGL